MTYSHIDDYFPEPPVNATTEEIYAWAEAQWLRLARAVNRQAAESAATISQPQE